MHAVQRSARLFPLYHQNLANVWIDGRIDVNVKTPVTAVLMARAARVASASVLLVLIITDNVEET